MNSRTIFNLISNEDKIIDCKIYSLICRNPNNFRCIERDKNGIYSIDTKDNWHITFRVVKEKPKTLVKSK